MCVCELSVYVAWCVLVTVYAYVVYARVCAFVRMCVRAHILYRCVLFMQIALYDGLVSPASALARYLAPSPGRCPMILVPVTRGRN